MLTLTVDSFAALARSSPWRWRTLRFVQQAIGARPAQRCWVRRPNDLRVEPLAGQDGRAEVFHAGPAQVAALVPSDGDQEPEPFRVLRQGDPGFPAPVVGADGLVTALPEFRHGFLDYDDPTPDNYHFVAMLNPVELAGGDDDPVASHRAYGRSVLIEDLAEVEHHGRPTWQAVLTPTERYGPRCACCALLYTALSADRVGFPADGLPVSYRARLDVQTGVCVQTTPLTAEGSIDQTNARHGHELAIEAVDEPMADELFVEVVQPRRGGPGRGRRSARRSGGPIG